MAKNGNEEPRDTKSRILDAAEQLFAVHGFASTSTRNITAEAQANLAAVNYHFGSKDALIQALFERRVGPINHERIGLLDEAERAAGDLPAALEDIVRAFLVPTLRLGQDPALGERVMRLLGHAMGDPVVRRILILQFGEVLERFSGALKRALPELPDKEIYWRYLFMVGAMVHSISIGRDFGEVYGLPTELDADSESIVRRFVTFMAAGLRAPAPSLESTPGSAT